MMNGVWCECQKYGGCCLLLNVGRIDGYIWLSTKNQISCWPRKDHAHRKSLATPSPLFHTDRAAFFEWGLLGLEWEVVPGGHGCFWRAQVFPWEQRMPVGVEFMELRIFFEVRSCDFPDLDTCSLSFKACYADLSCENGCSQLRWRRFAICHKMRFLTSLQVKHQIDLNFLLRDGSYFQNNIFLFLFTGLLFSQKRYSRNWENKCSLWMEK